MTRPERKLARITELLEKYPNKDCFLKSAHIKLSYPLVGNEICENTTKMTSTEIRTIFNKEEDLYLGIVSDIADSQAHVYKSITETGKRITWFTI